MALTDFRASASARGLDFFVMESQREFLDLNPPYQRGVVWGETRKRNLIRSLLQGVPIAAVVLNDRMAGWKDFFKNHCGESAPVYAVVDGKQRITAMRDFVDGKFAVPGEWFDVDADEVRFPDLELSAQRHFRHRPVAVCEAKLPDLASEELMFDLINFGGVPQGEADDDV